MVEKGDKVIDQMVEKKGPQWYENQVKLLELLKHAQQNEKKVDPQTNLVEEQELPEKNADSRVGDSLTSHKNSRL